MCSNKRQIVEIRENLQISCREKKLISKDTPTRKSNIIIIIIIINNNQPTKFTKQNRKVAIATTLTTAAKTATITRKERREQHRKKEIKKQANKETNKQKRNKGKRSHREFVQRRSGIQNVLSRTAPIKMFTSNSNEINKNNSV